MAEERTSGGVSTRLAPALFPIGDALAVERSLRARRPEVGHAQPGLRDDEVAHWRGLLDGSPTLGTLVDAACAEERARAAAAVAAAHSLLTTSAIVAGLLVIAIALPAIGQMFDVSLWLLVGAAYAWLGVFGALRAIRLGRFVRLGVDALAEPLERARQVNGEQWGSVLLVEARARLAAASVHDRALAEGIDAFVVAASACLRNAFVALAIWLVLNALPQAIAAAWHGLGRSFGA